MGCAVSISNEIDTMTHEKATLPHILMYGSSHCPWCKKQLIELQKGNDSLFTYTVVMCDKTFCPEAVKTVPTLYITTPSSTNPQEFIGYKPFDQLKTLLRTKVSPYGSEL